MTHWLAVGAGGALGSMARYGVSLLVAAAGWRVTPWSTAVVNVAGCFAIGLLAGAMPAASNATSTARSFLIVGVLGGFTTFSSFGLDTFTLVTTGARITALVNVIAQTVLGLVAVFVGYRLAH